MADLSVEIASTPVEVNLGDSVVLAAAQVSLAAAERALAAAAADAAETAATTAQAAAAAVPSLPTGETELGYESAGSDLGAVIASNIGILQFALDAGTHLEVGSIVESIRLPFAAASSATQTELKVWKRDVAAATTAGTLNSAAGVAQDTLLQTVTVSPTAVLGLTLNASPAWTNPLPLTTPFAVETGYSYVFQLRNLDVSNALVNLGYTYGSFGTVAQRRAGFSAATASPGTLTGINTARSPAVSVQVTERSDSFGEDVAEARELIDQSDVGLASRMNELNAANLHANAAIFPNTLAVPANFWGDSLIADAPGGGEPSGYKGTEMVDALTSGTVNNFGVGGETSSQITARVVAASAGNKAGFNRIQQGTNDSATAKTAAQILTDYSSCAAALTNANYLMLSPWATGGTLGNRKMLDVRSGLRTAYGAKFLDMQHLFARHALDNSDVAAARSGAPATGLTHDNLHNSVIGTLIKGRAWAAATIAQNGGAPFVHDDMVGFKNGDASGAAIATVRYLGDARNFTILAGNEDGAVEINRLTGALTRTAAAVAKPYRELFVTAESNKGRGRNGRVVLVQQMDGTAPTKAVRITGNKASIMVTRSDFAPTNGKEMTVVLCMRLGELSTLGYVIDQMMFKQSAGVRFAPKHSGGFVGDLTLRAEAPTKDFNFYFFTVKADTGVLKGVLNEGTAVTGSPTNADIVFDTIKALFSDAAGVQQLADCDVKMMAVYTTSYDVADAGIRANFYDPVTREPKDIGDGTAGGTFAAPLFYVRGMAGDYLLGKNYGSGGDFHVPLPIGQANLGFVDL